ARPSGNPAYERGAALLPLFERLFCDFEADIYGGATVPVNSTIAVPTAPGLALDPQPGGHRPNRVASGRKSWRCYGSYRRSSPACALVVTLYLALNRPSRAFEGRRAGLVLAIVHRAQPSVADRERARIAQVAIGQPAPDRDGVADRPARAVIVRQHRADAVVRRAPAVGADDPAVGQRQEVRGI